MIDLLRLASIFGNLGSNQRDYGTPPINPGPSGTFSGSFNPYGRQDAFVDNFNQPAQSYEQMLAELYQPNMEMQTRFRDLINQFPQREEPSKWRKFGALLTGLGGENPGEAMQLSNTAANLPYINKLQDWQAQANPLLKAVDDERMYNQQGLTIAHQAAGRRLEERRISETERRNKEVEEARIREIERKEAKDLNDRTLAERRAAVQEGYLTLAELKANNSYTFKVREDGQIMAINNLEPSKVQDTGIKSNELSDAQKIALGLQRDLKLQEARHQDRITEITTPRPPTQHTTISGGGSSGITPTQEAARVKNRVLQMSAERPDLFRFIDENTGRIKSNAPEAARQEINKYVYGETRPGPSVTPGPSNVPFNAPGSVPKAPPNTPLIRPADKAVLMFKDGQFGYVPAAQVAAAESQGYKRAQ